jgi:hypothetical protein
MSFSNIIRPALSSRKEIWENFPVSLIPLGRQNEADRHAVVWNRKNIVEWRKTCPDTNSWHVYEKVVKTLLMSELYRSTKWVVEPSEKEDQLCVIRMLFKGANNQTSNRVNRPANTVPTLTRLTDIRAFFPMVIWHQQSTKSYGIEICCKKLKGQDKSFVEQNLLRSLKASTAWTVSNSANPAEICSIALN